MTSLCPRFNTPLELCKQSPDKRKICSNYITLELWQMAQTANTNRPSLYVVYFRWLHCINQILVLLWSTNRLPSNFSELQLRIKAKSLSGEPGNRKVKCKMCWHFLLQPGEFGCTVSCNWVKAVKLQNRRTAAQFECASVHVKHA